MKFRGLISAAAAFAVITGLLPGAYAANATVTNAGKEYVCVDLTAAGANAIGFGTSETVITPENQKYYMGTVASGTVTSQILNKTATDSYKDENGYIWSKDNVPFKVSTEPASNNIVYLGGTAADTSITVTLPEDYYSSISYANAGNSTHWFNPLKVIINYADGTKKENSYGKNVIYGCQSSLTNAEKSFTSWIDCFTGSGAVSNAANKALYIGKSVQYWLPVWTVEADTDKKVTGITFTASATACNLAVIGVTGTVFTALDRINKLIDALPESSTVNATNYKSYIAKTEEISALITDEITVDSTRKTKLDEIIAKIDKYTNHPEETVEEFIDLLPEADTITIDNYADYVSTVEDIDAIYNEDMQISAEKKEKYLAVSKAVMRLANEKQLSDAITALPAADTLTEDNFDAYSDAVAEIKALIDGGVAVSDALSAKFDEFYTAWYNFEYRYNPFVTINYEKQCNGLLYGSYGMTLDDPTVKMPLFIGASTSEYPTAILNKAAFEGIKDRDGLVYTEKNKIPFDIDTDRAIIMGTTAVDRLSEVTIPIEQGVYKNIYVAYTGTWHLSAGNFTMEILYSDGTKTQNPKDWIPKIESSKLSDFDDYPDVRDYYIMPFDSSKSQETSYKFSLPDNSRSYTKLAGSTMYMPVLGVEADTSKTVTGIKLTMQATSIGVGIIAVTAEMPGMSELKTIIEQRIAALDGSTSLAKNYDEIYAVSNMLKSYNAAAGAEKIDGAASFEAIKNEFDGLKIEVTGVKNATTVKSITARVELTNPIAADKLGELTSMTLDGKEFKDYTVTAVSDKVLLFTIKNDFDYDKKYSFTLSSEIHNAQNKSFTLRSDYTWEYEPEAPFEFAELSVEDSAGKAVTDINTQKGKNVKVLVKLKNNTVADNPHFAMSVCLYDENGRLEKVYLEQHGLSAGSSSDPYGYTLAVPADEHTYTLKLFVWDGYATMNKLMQGI